MVRKIVATFVCALVLIAATCGTIQAATHSIYDNGTLSSTYTTYFRDIVSGIGFNDNYIAFRSGQYSYSLVVGELEYNNGVISSKGDCKEYKYYANDSGYNTQYKYNVSTLNSFSVNTADYIIYSDVGDFPQLIERGAKYEMLTTLLICIGLLCVVISRLFRHR